MRFQLTSVLCRAFFDHIVKNVGDGANYLSVQVFNQHLQAFLAIRVGLLDKAYFLVPVAHQHFFVVKLALAI